jgi:hypothetical protein
MIVAMITNKKLIALEQKIQAKILMPRRGLIP